MNLTITKIVRKGKFRSRIETSDGKQLVVDNSSDFPVVGQELPVVLVEASLGELRPLEAFDSFPEIVSSSLSD